MLNHNFSKMLPSSLALCNQSGDKKSWFILASNLNIFFRDVEKKNPDMDKRLDDIVL